MSTNEVTILQILTQCVRYLLDVVGGIEKTAGNMYANQEQDENVTGAYYDFDIGVNGLPYFKDRPIMKQSEVNVGGENLTPTIESLQSQITALDGQLKSLQTTVSANKNSADSQFASINGSISSLDTRVTALESK